MTTPRDDDLPRLAAPPRAAAPPPSRPRGRDGGRRGGPTIPEYAAIVLSATWLGLAAWVFAVQDPAVLRALAASPLDLLMVGLGVLLPVGLVWVAASAARTARTLRAEGARLQAALEALRDAQQAQARAARDEMTSAFEDRLRTLARTQAELGHELAALAADRGPERILSAPERPRRVGSDHPAPRPAPEEDPPAGRRPAPAGGQALADRESRAETVRALDFPRTATDQEGFKVLRRVLDRTPQGEAVKAAQDILTLLSQDGIFMDDLAVPTTDPDVWRAFAEGGRGEEVAGLGAVRDRSSVALASARLREDPVFRDTAEQFVQGFARMLGAFVDGADDAEIAALSRTRSARAFMLTGRCMKLFS